MKKLLFCLPLFLIAVIFISAGSDDQQVLINSKAALGKKLFNDHILSKDSSISCSSCHKPLFAFSDTIAFSLGINGILTRRNTPSVLNMKNRPYYFWDGRASTLEEQAMMPIQNPDEMGLPISEAIERLNNSTEYISIFKRIFNRLPDEKNLAEAFAAYENTLETVNSKFDDWSNNIKNLNASEERGRQVFIGKKAKCFDCHFMEDFTDDSFKNIGLFNGKELNDSGRYNITNKTEDIGKFKTPGLRNIAVTAPYMHNGMFKTLEQVVEYYNDPKKLINNSINLDTTLSKPLGLTAREKSDLVAFLKTLTDKAFLNKNK